MFLTIKLCTYIYIVYLHLNAKLNRLKWNCFVCYTELFEMELFLTLKLYLG